MPGSCYGMCILEEMQWIRTRPVHAAEFFHGMLELIEDGVSVLLLKEEDAARPLAERVEAFVPRYGGLLTVLDSTDYEYHTNQTSPNPAILNEAPSAHHLLGTDYVGSTSWAGSWSPARAP